MEEDYAVMWSHCALAIAETEYALDEMIMISKFRIAIIDRKGQMWR